MNITPKDILEKEFGKKLNGYDPEQVDEFLDEIIKQFESLLEENEDTIVKNEALKSEVARLKQKTEKIEDVEEKLMAAVVTAQRNATMYVERAEAQAKKTLEIANQNAKTVIESTHLRMETLAGEIRKYEKVIADFKAKFKLFLQDQASYVDVHLNDDETLSQSAAELSRSINDLTKQIQGLDGQPQREEEAASYQLNDILNDARKVEVEGEDNNMDAAYRQSEYDLKQSTANLQEIVNEIIDD